MWYTTRRHHTVTVQAIFLKSQRCFDIPILCRKLTSLATSSMYPSTSDCALHKPPEEPEPQDFPTIQHQLTCLGHVQANNTHKSSTKRYHYTIPQPQSPKKSYYNRDFPFLLILAATPHTTCHNYLLIFLCQYTLSRGNDSSLTSILTILCQATGWQYGTCSTHFLSKVVVLRLFVSLLCFLCIFTPTFVRF